MLTATNIKTTRDEERWEFEVRAEIPAASIAQYRAEALKELSGEATIDGFRPGKAPEAVVLKHFGEPAVLAHAAEHAVQHELPEILAKEGANIVDTPRVSVVQPQEGQPIVFTARAPLAPEIKLPDYKKIAVKTNSGKSEQTVTDEEHTQTLAHLKRERARIDSIESGKQPQEAAEHAKKIEDKDLPAIDDDFARSVGYDSAQAFEDAVRANLKNEKELREAEKRRATMLDELVKNSTIKYPALLKEYELEDMEARMAGDLERMGSTLDAFLTQSKKTREELHKDWLPAADNRAKVRLVLAEIARKENIEPNPETLAHEMEHAQKHYKDADPAALRAHISHAMRNEAVITWLEEQN